MALNKTKALETAKSIFNDQRKTEAIRLNRIHKAMEPTTEALGLEVPHGSPEVAEELLRQSETNYLPLVVKTLVQSMHIEGFQPGIQTGSADLWKIWQRNQMDARQAALWFWTLKFGTGYAIGLPGSPDPRVLPISPRKLTALYDDTGEDDEWPIYALRVEPKRIYLYDDEEVYRFKIGDSSVANYDGSRWEFMDSKAHLLGVCPVVRFREHMQLDDDEQMGVVEPIMSIQERIRSTVFGMSVVMWYQAFKFRFITGITATEEEELQARASTFATFTNPAVQIGQLDASDPAGYLAAADAAIKQMASISQIPPQALANATISNISAEGLAALETQKDRNILDWQKSLGESSEQLFRLIALAAKDTEGANDMEAEVRWRDTTSRSLAQVADAVTKLAGANGLGIPPHALWRMLPVSETELAQWEAESSKQDVIGTLLAGLNNQAPPALPGAPAPAQAPPAAPAAA